MYALRGATTATKPFSKVSPFCTSAMNVAELERSLVHAVKSIIPPLSHNRHKGEAGRIGVVGGCQEDAEDINQEVSRWLPRLHSLVIGPGLGADPCLHKNTRTIIEKAKVLNIPLVLDAEGIQCATQNHELLNNYHGVIFTPNVVEFSALYKRLFGSAPADDASAIGELCQKLEGVTIVRKGHPDVIANSNGTVLCQIAGGRRRCGGQGDLLAGSMAVFLNWSRQSVKGGNSNALLEQYGPEIIAAFGACALTRNCHDIAFRHHGRAMLTSDMIQQIHVAFDSLYGNGP